jgi:hypothetical protein
VTRQVVRSGPFMVIVTKGEVKYGSFLSLVLFW